MQDNLVIQKDHNEVQRQGVLLVNFVAQKSSFRQLRQSFQTFFRGVIFETVVVREFYRREFKTDSRALIPRPETEELASIILNQDLPPSLTILDVGTGSGVLGLSLAAELGVERRVELFLLAHQRVE